VADHFTLVLLTAAHSWMKPPQYVNTDRLAWLFRVADPSVRKGWGFLLLPRSTTGTRSTITNFTPTLENRDGLWHAEVQNYSKAAAPGMLSSD